jgi:exodeoxyribonuclease-3
MPIADEEGRVSWVDLFEGEETVRVYSIYFPSGTSGEERQAVKDGFNHHIQGLLRRHLERGDRVAVCGDVNTAHTKQDIHNPTGNKKNSGFLPHERAWMTELLAEGWVDLFRTQHPDAQTYSWWSNRGQARAKDRGWRIDYILCSPALAELALSCEITGREPKISDHCAVNATFRRQ